MIPLSDSWTWAWTTGRPCSVETCEGLSKLRKGTLNAAMSALHKQSRNVSVSSLVCLEYCRCNANWAPGIPFSEPAEKPALDPRKMLLPCLQLLLQFPCGSSGDPWLPADQGVAPGATGTSHAVHAVSSIDRLVLDSAMLLMCAALLPVSSKFPSLASCFHGCRGGCALCQYLQCSGRTEGGEAMCQQLVFSSGPLTGQNFNAFVLPCLRAWPLMWYLAGPRAHRGEPSAPP